MEGRGASRQQGDPRLSGGLSSEAEGVCLAPSHHPARALGHPLLDTCPDAPVHVPRQRARAKDRVRSSLNELTIHETQKALALLLLLVWGSCLHISQALRPAPHKNNEEKEPPG